MSLAPFEIFFLNMINGIGCFIITTTFWSFRGSLISDNHARFSDVRNLIIVDTSGPYDITPRFVVTVFVGI